jgi:hypothetical protein
MWKRTLSFVPSFVRRADVAEAQEPEGGASCCLDGQVPEMRAEATSEGVLATTGIYAGVHRLVVTQV